MSCSKDEAVSNTVLKYKLSGWYYRDTAIKNDGLKGINFTPTGDYCWLRVVNTEDSLTCFGKYEQTSDSTLLWNSVNTVNFKITPLDSFAPNYMQLQVFTQPPSFPLFGYYTKP